MEKTGLKTPPLVSVCIPAYNCEKYIGECLKSIIGQTYQNLEIIVVDDGSTDGTAEVIQLFYDKRLKFIKQNKSGAATARNKALSVANGTYIQFMDADDLLSSDKIEKQVIALTGCSKAVAVCSTVHFFDNYSPYESRPSAYEDQFLYTTNNPIDFMVRLWGGYDFNGSMVQPNAWLTPKSLIDISGGWNEQLTLDDDGEFFTRVVLNCEQVIYSEGLNYYRKYKDLRNNLSSFSEDEGLRSFLESTLLKKKNLFDKRRDAEASRAVYRQLITIAVRTYLVNPTVYHCVRSELKQLPDFKFKENMGGAAINYVAHLAGWKFAKRIQLLLKRFSPR